MVWTVMDLVENVVRVCSSEQTTYLANDSDSNAWSECDDGTNHPSGIVAPGGKLKFAFSVPQFQLTVKIYDARTQKTKSARFTCLKGTSWIIKNSGMYEQRWSESIWTEKPDGLFYPWAQDSEARSQDAERQLTEMAGESSSLPSKPKRLPPWGLEDIPSNREPEQKRRERLQMYKEEEDRIRDVFRSRIDKLCEETVPDPPLINLLYQEEFYSDYFREKLMLEPHKYDRSSMLYSRLDTSLEGYRIKKFLDCMKQAGNGHIVQRYFDDFT